MLRTRTLYALISFLFAPLISHGGLGDLPFGLRSGISIQEAKLQLSKRKVITYNVKYSKPNNLNYDVKGIVFNEIEMTNFDVFFSNAGDFVYASMRGKPIDDGQDAYNTLVKLFKFCKEQNLDLAYQKIDELDKFGDLDGGSIAAFNQGKPITVNINSKIVEVSDKDYYIIELQWMDIRAGQKALDQKAEDKRRKDNNAVNLLE